MTAAKYVRCRAYRVNRAEAACRTRKLRFESRHDVAVAENSSTRNCSRMTRQPLGVISTARVLSMRQVQP
jgi:hypothetical protein